MQIFGKSIGAGRRQSTRSSSLTLGVLSTVEDDCRVALVNVSRRGARVAAPDLPGKGADVIFRSDAVEAFGRVVWSRKGQCGILFEPPILADQVVQLRREANMAA